MDSDRWRRVEALYHSAQLREPGTRAAYLAEACEGDKDLQREVESLLAQDVSGGDWLDRPAWEGASSLLKSPPSSRSTVNLETESPPSGESDSGRDPPPGPAQRSAFFWVVGFAALVTIASFAYSALGLLRHSGTAKEFGWSEERSGDAWFVSSVDPAGPAAGRLQPGDQVVSLNGDSFVAAAGTRPYRRSFKIGETYQLSVRRDGTPRKLTLAVEAGERRLTSSLTWYAVSLVWCGVGLFIGFMRPDRLQARLAFLAAIATGLVFLRLGTFQGNLALWQPLHAVLGYHFFCRFPSGASPRRFWTTLLWLLYGGGAFAAATRQPINWSAFTDGPSGVTRYLALHSGLLSSGRLLGLSVFCCATVAMAVVIGRNYHLITDTDQRRRIRWVIYCSLAALVPQFWWSAVAFYEVFIGPAPVSRFSLAVCAATVTIPMSVAYAVLKHRVLDIKVAIRLGVQYLLAKQALQALLSFPVLALAYTAVVNRNQTIGQLVTRSPGYIFWIAAAGLSLKFRRPLRDWLDRKFFREQYDREQVLLGVLDEVGKLESIREVSLFVSRRLELALHPKALHLWYRDAHDFVLTHSSQEHLKLTKLPSGGRLLPLLEQAGGFVAVPLPPKLGLSKQESRWLAELAVHLMVPVNGSDGRLAGVLMLGEKKSEEPYSASDRRLLDAIAKQVAVVFENLRLKAQVGEELRIRYDVLERLDPGLGNLLKECPSCGACFDSSAETCERDGRNLTLSLPVARTIDGKYRLDQLIGKGGMGAVYEARDLRLERSVAVKVIVGRAFSEESGLRRFEREARAAARLNHPNIVSVYDCGRLDAGGAYLVMERVHGVTLRAELNRLGVLPPSTAAEWFEQILAGVAAAHMEGIVHRDLKPENVVGRTQRSGLLAVKILDFGLAKFQPLGVEAAAMSSLTARGVIVGTFGYMPPEQLEGHNVDQRCDIFAAGVMLVEMLTGRRPFGGENYGELMHAMLHDTYHLPGLSSEIRALDDLLGRCLAKQPQDRFSSAEELRRELVPVLRACPPLHPRMQ